jgi:nucleotide-binding universal stress UspA family protein
MDGPILIASDGSPGSEGALGLGIALARAKQRRLEILTVMEPLPLYGLGELPAIPQGYSLLQSLAAEDLRSAVTRQIAKIDPEGSWPVVAEIGPAAAAIVQHARKIGAELIIAGSGPHFATDWWLRSETALNVVRLAHLPVLLVPPLVREPPQSALAAVDFSEFSVHAARAVIPLLKEGGRLFLGHVMWAPMETEALPSLAAYWTTYRTGAIARLEALAAELRTSSGIQVETSVMTGDPAHELLGFASRLNVDLIAAGSHGHGYLSRVLMGSVSTRLIRGTRTAILIIPPATVSAQLEKYVGKHEPWEPVGQLAP